MSGSPYRLEVVRPVCATCKHRVDARVMEPEAPWRDWLCAANEYESWPAEYNPITGVTTPARRSLKRCREVNMGGQCGQYEQAAARTGLATDHFGPPDVSSAPPPNWLARVKAWWRS